MSDEDLIRASVKGDNEAFYKLISQYSQSLYNTAYCYLKDQQEALEAVQETTCRAFMQLKKLKHPEYFKTWLTRILINYCIDEQARRKRFSPLNSEDASHEETSQVDNLVINSAVDNLKPKYKHVIILKYYRDMTLSDIARIMDCPEGTVKTWLHRALELLRQSLGKEGDFNV